MSRFTPTRWNRIMVWTGASLAWGTAFVAAKVEPVRAQETKPDPASEAVATNTAAMPQAPASGLSIIRYKPTAAPAPEIKKVYVQVAVPATPKSSGSQKVASANTGSVQPPPPPPPAVNPPPPNPPSSGS
jgi:hypothetical protein